MKYRITLIAALIVVCAQAADAQNRTHRRRGAVLGGIAGAALGVAIGDKGGNETAGALIGGTVGAIAGGTIGDAKDRRIEHDRRYHRGGNQYYTYPNHGQYQSRYGYQNQYYVHPQPVVVPVYPQTGVNPTQPLSNNDVLAMVQSGLSESMVIRQIHLRGMLETLSVADIIFLHQQGISEPILQTMQGIR